MTTAAFTPLGSSSGSSGGTIVVSSKEYTIYIDAADPDNIYIGKTLQHEVDEAAAVWQLMKIETATGISKIKYALGNTDFTNAWSDRASLSYGAGV